MTQSKKTSKPNKKTKLNYLAPLNKKLLNGSFIAFDIETTGGNPTKNGITEICAIKYHKGKIIDKYYTLTNPCIKIPPIVRKMTGITNKMLKDEPKIEEVLPAFIKFVGTDILVSHNTIGDIKFFRHYCESALKHKFDNYFLCTHLLVEKLIPEAPVKSLTGLNSFLKLENEDKLHRAEADAIVTLKLFQILVNKLLEKNITVIKDAIYFQGDLDSGVRLGWGVSNKSIFKLPEEPGVVTLVDKKSKDQFIFGALNIKEEVLKLKKYKILSKKLLRTILKVNNINFKITKNGFEALLEESAKRRKHTKMLEPTIFHNRYIQSLYLVKTNHGFALKIGKLGTDTIAAFGPVRDKKYYYSVMKDISEKLKIEIVKNTLTLPIEYLEFIISVFENDIQTTFKNKTPKKNKFKWFFNKKYRANYKAILNALDSLKSIQLPKNIFSFLNIDGVVKILNNDNKTWSIYEIKSTKFVKKSTISNIGQVELKSKIILNKNSRITKSLDAEESQNINAVLWWVVNQEKIARF